MSNCNMGQLHELYDHKISFEDVEMLYSYADNNAESLISLPGYSYLTEPMALRQTL